MTSVCKLVICLYVLDAPELVLAMGKNIDSSDIVEGNDVYLECHVLANPPPRKVIWMHNVNK